jgi:transposase-like protein
MEVLKSNQTPTMTEMLVNTAMILERAHHLKVAIAEMHLQGVSTRRVTALMEKLCGMKATSCEVSRLTAVLGTEFQL